MSTGYPRTTTLFVRQTRHQLLTFWRTPEALFFTLAFPVIILVLFNALFGDSDIDTDEGSWSVRQFYTGGLAAYTAVSATFTNLANMVPIRRDEGVLKRWRGTPLPTWVYISGFVASSVVIAFVGVVLMLALGVVAYDLDVEAAKLPAAAVTFLVGVTAFAALGMAVAAVIPSAASASAIANVIILPLAFVSNVFIVTDDAPDWIGIVGDIFPLKPFVESFQDCFNPLVDPPAFSWANLAYVLVWGAVGAFVAVRRFRWEPHGSTTRRRRARRGSAAADTQPVS